MRRAKIAEQNRYLLRQQQDFRRAADVVTNALMTFEEVEAIAVIGSVAKALWKEVPRFSEFRRAGIEVWHECKDLDLAAWISSQCRLRMLRQASDRALREACGAGTGPSIANHQVDIFLIESGTDRYLGRLCKFNACPKDKPQCAAPGCGAIAFNKVVNGFVPAPRPAGIGRIRDAVPAWSRPPAVRAGFAANRRNLNIASARRE
jgi:hypothetical protein